MIFYLPELNELFLAEFLYNIGSDQVGLRYFLETQATKDLARSLEREGRSILDDAVFVGLL